MKPFPVRIGLAETSLLKKYKNEVRTTVLKSHWIVLKYRSSYFSYRLPRHHFFRRVTGKLLQPEEKVSTVSFLSSRVYGLEKVSLLRIHNVQVSLKLSTDESANLCMPPY